MHWLKIYTISMVFTNPWTRSGYLLIYSFRHFFFWFSGTCKFCECFVRLTLTLPFVVLSDVEWLYMYISLSLCSLLVYGNIIDFYTFVLYPVTLLNWFINSWKFLWVPWDFLCGEACCLQTQTILFLPFCPGCLAFLLKPGSLGYCENLGHI